MNLKLLYLLGRFGPLTAWSGAGVLLAVGVSIAAVGVRAVAWPLFIAGALVALLLQYVAHPINDIVDYEVDVKANIQGTGRDKTLISGLATARDLKAVAIGVVALCVVLSAAVIYYRPLAFWFGIVGFAAVAAYNLPPLRLSYHPFSEPLMGFPTCLAIVVGLSYVATNQLLVFAVPVAILAGFMIVAVHVTYFAMDVQSDLWGGKNSTVATFPRIYWSTFWPALGFVYSVIVAILSTPVFFASTVLFVAMVFMGVNVDEIRARYMTHVSSLTRAEQFETARGNPPRFTMDTWNRASAAMRLTLVQQVKVAILHGVVLSILIAVLL